LKKQMGEPICASIFSVVQRQMRVQQLQLRQLLLPPLHLPMLRHGRVPHHQALAKQMVLEQAVRVVRQMQMVVMVKKEVLLVGYLLHVAALRLQWVVVV
jgi:hypothetical protein